jgi:hypothetical protein
MMLFAPIVHESWESLCERCGWTGQIPSGVHMDVLRESKFALDQAKTYADRKNWRMSEVYVRSAVAMLQSPDASFVKRRFVAWNNEDALEKIRATFARLAQYEVLPSADLTTVIMQLARIDAAFLRQDGYELDQSLQEYERKAQVWRKR